MINREHALRHPDGRYYTGRVNTDEKPNYWLGSKEEAFLYTKKGAQITKDTYWCFRSFTIVQVS